MEFLGAAAFMSLMVGHVLAVVMASSEPASDHPGAPRTRCAT
jgi:hypothetical protein